MNRFVVRKNTLPYVHQWSIIDSSTGNKIGEFKDKIRAEYICQQINKCGIHNPMNQSIFAQTDDRGVKLSPIDFLETRINHPETHPPIKQIPKNYSNKRKIKLDD